jgi:hypothetical protein
MQSLEMSLGLDHANPMVSAEFVTMTRTWTHPSVIISRVDERGGGNSALVAS